MAFTKRRRQKRDTLIRYGFTPHEASELSRVPTSKMPYIRTMKRHRLTLTKDAKTKREALALIRKEYTNKGWRDVFSMMRDYRQRKVATGWESPGMSKSKLKRDHQEHKGDVKAQKARYRAKVATKQTGRSAIYDKVDATGKPTGEKVRFDYDTGEFIDV